LAVWLAMHSVCNPTGAVLCFEADGSMSIETPAEQRACHSRHGQMTVDSRSKQTRLRPPTAHECVDVPLSLFSGTAIRSPAVSRISHIARLFRPAIISATVGQSAVGASTVNSAQTFGHQLSPPASVALLSTVVLLI
jgi:hypothetical protein